MNRRAVLVHGTGMEQIANMIERHDDHRDPA